MDTSFTEKVIMVFGVVMNICVLPILFLNIFSGIIAFIWLAILGEWIFLLIGFFISMGFPFYYSIIDLPAIGFAFLLVYFAEKKWKIPAIIAGFLATLYNNALNLIWVTLIFLVAIRQAASGNYLPYIFWGYATALSPLLYMRSKESPDAYATTFGLFIAEIWFILLAISFMMRLPLIIALCIIGILLLFVFYISLAIAWEEMQERDAFQIYDE